MHPLSSHAKAQLMRSATLVALVLALTLTLAKGIAWWLSGSVSLLAGVIDSLLDSAASLFNLLAVHYALRPADHNHKYGHAKAEALAGLVQAVVIGASAIAVAYQAIVRIRDPIQLTDQLLGMLVIFMSLLATCGLLWFQHYVIKRTGSTAIRADALHYRSDLLLNGSILLALGLSRVGYSGFDAWFGLLIAASIFYSVASIVKQSVNILMDRELDASISQHMQRLAKAVPEVQACYGMRTRDSGQKWFVQLHIELNEHTPLSQVESISSCIERNIQQHYPQAEVWIQAHPSSSR